ncbi:DUF262 domain-containing protein [Prosthecobacter sp.]|jgi:hypothetical protein|uniref:DUF262 domain-containing protein n=1 Tax=Prosthecobacter sp. TaxID=1965333 RepID=UPI0037CB38CB
MNRVWKVASRWSETGTAESSILDIFRRHNVVFVGRFQDRFQQIGLGDLIVISDAKRVVAMGLATTLPQPVTELGIEFTEDDLRKFDCEDHVLCCRLSFSDLGEEEQPSYRVSTFHGVNERADEFRRIFTEHRQRFEERQQFEIKARSCTLARNVASPADTLWQNGLVFRVPVYQRAYSWKEGEVRRLLGDLLANFLGLNGRPVEEPMFIGTMQLTEKRILDVKSGRHMQEVIDGQQRLSTLILLLNILKARCPELPVWVELDLANRIETAVSSGAQQRYLQEALEADLRDLPVETQNPYLYVVPLMQQLLDEAGGDSGEEFSPGSPLEVERFAAYLLGRVYFVVIETRATLSKTLQIFDAINTSGMDLNGGDVFKVRYYEYLRATRNVEESEFERISGLYQVIDERNREAGRTVCGIEEILSLARHILVARHDLPKTLHDYGAAVFFDRFFDTVLCVNEWPNFSLATCRKADVRLEEFARLIAVRFDWLKDVPALSAEARSMLDFIWWSRYSKYHYLIVLFRDRFGADLALTGRFIVQLAKLLVMFSIVYWRAVNELHAVMHRVVGMMFGASATSTAEDVIDTLRKVAADNRWKIENAFEVDAIAGNVRAKGLTCRLAAFLHELEEGLLDAEELRRLIFDTEIDIEHIESVNHKNETERARIHELWQGELHRIGNLIVLESSLNRSISNEDYKTVKVPAYRSRSAFRVVKTHAAEFPDWNLDICKQRKDILKRALVDYLCS